MKRDSIVRFWEKVKIKKPNECWFWQAGIQKGYGCFWNGRMSSAHRFSWVLANGKIPIGLSVCHKCDNPLCVNPAHLFLGTQVENIQDSIKKGRFSRARGERQHLSKLTDSKVKEMRELQKTGLTFKKLAETYGVTIAAAHRAVRGFTWKHVVGAKP